MLRSLVLLSLVAAALPAAAQPACQGIRCSGHGECLEEDGTPLCFCDEGYSADGVRCLRAPALRPPAPGAAERAAQLAAAEDGHDLSAVGAGLGPAGTPGPLALFVRPGGLWCSDFVSWAYRAAGASFTGGYQGGWLLPTNLAIRRWFVRRDAFVDRDSAEWESFEPRPGDYVRIHTSTWGHSAIVRAVEGRTLHLVEGNAGGHVRLTVYTRFKDHERIDGFGSFGLAWLTARTRGRRS